LAVGVFCLLVAGSLLVSLTGATRDLSQAQTCAHNLRQMYTGLTAYVNQYNSYPPNNPYPTYMASETINGITTLGWDPNIGFIMTHGLGLTPPVTDTAGHFKWYGTAYADLPDVCKCPSMSPDLLNPANPEVDSTARETNLYQYALSYMTSGTCRAATTLVRERTNYAPGVGGRNPPIPDPSNGVRSSQQYDNAQLGAPYVWVQQHNPAAPGDPTAVFGEYSCWVQAVAPSEVDQPGRVFYMADSRDYRPMPGAYPRAGQNSGWGAGYGNQLLMSARHYGYGNVLYLDGAVSRDGQTHQAQWYDAANSQWRVATFDTNVRLANISGQMPIMPVFMVKGWEAFFDASGLKAK
jgi:prepilin-type processing-associated H-X9-DG protein